MRIATLNVQNAGNEELGRLSSLWALVLTKPEPDCIVFTEFNFKSCGQWFYERAKTANFTCVSHTSQSRGVLIAAKSNFNVSENTRVPPEYGEERMLRATFDKLTVYGLYLPQGLNKEAYLKYLIQEARQRPDDKIICIGDFNTGNYSVDAGPGRERKGKFESSSFPEFASLWTDAWREKHPNDREYSWFSRPRGSTKDPHIKRRGFRIDHCFVSAPLVSRIRSADYDHRPREMTYKPSKAKPSKKGLPKTLTDHSGLIVEIEM